MEYSIVRVNKDNYSMFDDMVFYRKHGCDKNEDELKEKRDYTAIYVTLDNNNLYIYAVQTEDKFVGYISIVYIPKVGRTHGNGHMFIDELWVHPDYRRKGMANTLIKKADMLSKEMNTLGLRLYVNTANDAGISLYKKCGYENKFGKALFMEKEW